MATTIPTWDAKRGQVSYRGQNYNIVMINNIAKKKTRSAAEEMVLAAYRRATATGTSGYKPQKTVTGSVPKPSTVNQLAAKAASSSSASKPATNWLKAGAAPLWNKPKPSGGTPGGTIPGGTPAGTTSWSDMMGQNYVNPTIQQYNMRSDDELRQEASQAAAGIYNPVMNALYQAQANYEKSRQLGREDLASKYAQQIADLKALSVASQGTINQQKESSMNAYTQAAQQMQGQTQQAQQTNAGNYDALQNMYGGELGQLGLTNQIAPSTSGILRDKNFTDAMLQGVGNIGQTGLASGKTAAETAMGQLAANSASEFNSLQGQAGISRDEAVRQLDMDTLQKVMQGQLDIGKTQGEWNSKAYELLKQLQGTEWSKYMDAGGAAFQQGATNAQLGLDAATAANQAAAAQNQYMTPTDYGTQFLQQQFGNNPRYKDIQEVWQLVTSPHNYSDSPSNNPFGISAAPGYYPGLGGYAGSPQFNSNIPDLKARAYMSLASRGLIGSQGANDPVWQNFNAAMDKVLSSNKKYDLTAL